MRFSVIVPAHNSAIFIQRGLRSIRRQTFTDYELIVVCDCCTDDTPIIAADYADRVEFCAYHRDGMTRNKGLERAQGDWVIFMDDDDWWQSTDAFWIINDHAVLDAVAFGFYFNGRGIVGPRGNRGFYWPACWSRAYRREILDGCRFSDEKAVSDVAFYKAFMAKRPRIVDIPDVLYYYNYMRPGSQSWRMQNDD